MIQSWLAIRLAIATLIVSLSAASASAAEPADAATLLADMQRALVPSAAQFSRVHITAHSDQPGGGTRQWDALVIRQRDENGPYTVLSFLKPDSLTGSGVLTAPHPVKHSLALWLYSPGEQRAVEYSPLEADRQFLESRFNFEDVVLTSRDTQPPQLRGSERIGAEMAWQVETRPLLDRYYSRMLTWIADDTRMPIKREYYDRGGKLWKVVSYRSEVVDGIPTVMAIDLHDVQSRDTAVWQVKVLRYAPKKLDPRVLGPSRLGTVQNLAFWHQLDNAADSDEQTHDAE